MGGASGEDNDQEWPRVTRVAKAAEVSANVFPSCTMASDVGDEGRLIDGVANQ
jgi:hypothetical protein